MSETFKADFRDVVMVGGGSGGDYDDSALRNLIAALDANKADKTAIPTGGTTGQVLTKRSDADGDYGWKNKLPSYVVDKPEGSNPVSGIVAQVGSFVNTNGTEYGIYEFYYKTSALPGADATKEYPLTPLLDNYDVFDFIDATGVTSNGFLIGNGRTDGTGRVIAQQFSKNRKTVMLRAYGDYTGHTALLKIKFIGTKTV